MHPPVKQPNLTRKFPLTDMPTGVLVRLTWWTCWSVTRTMMMH